MSDVMEKSPVDLAARDLRAGIGLEPQFEPTPSLGRYRVTFKDSRNEAEPPRSEEFTARGLPTAKAEALRRSRVTEVVVDLVPLS